jgi:hypothetical protein
MRRRVCGIDRLQTQFQRSSAEYTKFIVKRFLLLARRNQHDNLRERMSRLRLECCRPVTLDGVAIFRLPSDVCPFINQFSNSTSRLTARSTILLLSKRSCPPTPRSSGDVSCRLRYVARKPSTVGSGRWTVVSSAERRSSRRRDKSARPYWHQYRHTSST